MMDNKKLEIWIDSKSDFDLAMKIAIGSRKTIGYLVDNNRLALCWAECEGMVSVPYAMNVQQATDFVWGWVQNTLPNYKKPDHDGETEKGVRVFTEDWGHVFSKWEAFVGVEPIWAVYGK